MSRAPLALLAAALRQACAATATPSSRSATPSLATTTILDAAAKARIDSTFRAYVQSGRLIGVSAVVWEKGQERYFGAFGLADREAGRPMERNSIAQIHSMTKPITLQ